MRIIDYEPRHAEAWRTLNEAWITRWFAIEPKDRKALDDPEGAILAHGGRIFIAEDGEAAVGCVALAPMDDGGYEVAKMTVAEAARERTRPASDAGLRGGRARGRRAPAVSRDQRPPRTCARPVPRLRFPRDRGRGGAALRLPALRRVDGAPAGLASAESVRSLPERLRQR